MSLGARVRRKSALVSVVAVCVVAAPAVAMVARVMDDAKRCAGVDRRDATRGGRDDARAVKDN